MPTTVARIRKEGELLLKNTLDERVPTITDNGWLKLYYPLDGDPYSSGSWNDWSGSVSGTTYVQDLTKSNVRLAQGTVVKFRGQFRKTHDFTNLVSFFNYHQLDGVWQWHSVGWFQGEIGIDWTNVEKTYTVPGTAGTITNFVQGITVRDGANAGRIEWRNCEMMVLPASYSGVVFGPDGASVQAATTNLYSSKVNNRNDWLNAGSLPTVIDDDFSLPRPINDPSVSVRSFYSSDPSVDYHFGFDGVDVTNNTTYTASVWYYQGAPNTWTSPYVRGWDSNTNYGSLTWENGSADATTWPVKRWIRLFRTFSTTTVDTKVYISGYPPPFCKVAMCAPQLEQRAFHTSFVRTSNSGADLRFPLTFSNNMTFSFRHRPTMPYSAQVNQGTYPNIFEIGNYYSNSSLTFWKYGSNVVTYIKGDTGSGWQHTFGHISPMAESDWLTDHHWTLVLSGSSGWETYKVYRNGSLVTTHTISPAITTVSGSFFAFGSYGGAHPNATYRDLAIYDRALSDSEVRVLAGSGFSPSEKHAVTDEFHETSWLPSGSYYFPLSSDTYDVTRSTAASEESNLVFDENGAWVGQGTSNALYTPAINSLPTIGNSWGTFNVNQYNNGQYRSIGSISSVIDNVVTTSTPHGMRTYDVMRPQTSGGGLTAETDYFVRRVSDTSFTLHQYNGSQDGSQGYVDPSTGDNKVHESVAKDVRVAVNSTGFPTMWWGAAHRPNSGLVKEIIRNGFRGTSSGWSTDCVRLHYKRDDNVCDGMAYGADATVTQNSPVTVSFYTRSDTSTAVGRVCSFQAYNYTASYSFNYTLGPQNLWQRHAFTFTPTTSNSCASYWFPEGGKYRYDLAGIQYEVRPFATPFTSSYRSASFLEYNLYSSIGLNWGGDWTICYWKKPMGTYTGDLNGYNIESVGCNSNTVGGGYLWWGKDTVQNKIYQTTYTFDPSSYFGKWQFVSLVKSGTTVTIITRMYNGDVAIRTVSVGVITANAYLTQYGYDLQLGGWDDSNPTNTYFSDLLVVKRALTDSELTDAYKQFSIYKTKAQARKLTEEGI